MDRKKFSKSVITAGMAFCATYFSLDIVAGLKKKKEASDEDLQKDKYDNAGKPVKIKDTGIYDENVKPVIDKILAFLGLIILSPLYLVIVLAIYIDDPGPVLFTQKRVGKNKEFFRLHKFRSMKMATPHDVPTHMLSNPEQYITRVGKVLRKYSLDELPQIWDIFTGNMSVIGPRPALWNQADLVAERDKYGANDVKPGLTGWAQINGRDELEIPAKAKLDGEYVARESFFFDVKCFFETIVIVAGHKGVVEGNKDLSQENNLPVFEPGFNENVTVDFSQRKKILITGAGSYIGESFKVYAEKRYPENFIIDTIDMIDGSWRKADFSEYDTVFHVAGLAHADIGSVDEATKKKYYEINTDLAIETAQKAKNSGVKQFVFMSSIIVYGDSAAFGEKKQITKYTQPNPANFYGDSKWQADKGVRELADADYHVLVLRPPMIYGRESKGNYRTLANLAKKIPVFPNISNERSMLHIDNLCEFLCKVMLVGKGGIFFPQNSEYTQTSKLVKEIGSVNGRKVILCSAFNPLLTVASKIPGKISGLINKAFGSITYAQELSVYPGIEYRVVDLKKSVISTEGVNSGEKEKPDAKKPRALMLASVASMIDQFNMDNIKILLDIGYDVDVVADFVDGGTITSERTEELKNRLEALGVSVYHVAIPREVFDVKKIIKAYKQVRTLCNDRQYKILHCHSPIGGVIARYAARKARKSGTKIIYTAHGFHFYAGAPKKNWLLFYPIEKMCSRWTDVLITINKEDYQRARKSFHARKVIYIPGVGVDTEKFRECNTNKIEKRKELDLPEKVFVLLSVGELQARKNHKIVIEALHRLNNPDIYYLIVGRGELEEEYAGLIKGYSLGKNVRLLGYRTDIDEICIASDCFVHPSIREGLGIAPLEAMASGLPLISADVNGIRDYTKNGVTGYCVNPESVEDMSRAIDRMWKEEEFRIKCGYKNMEIVKQFDILKTHEIMRETYSENLIGGGVQTHSKTVNKT